MSSSITTTLAAAVVAVGGIGAGGAFGQSGAAAWKPVPGHIMSEFAEKVTADHPLNDYPRPQLERDAWTNLNGLWDYAITDGNAPQPTAWDGKILVPFAPEAALSGVGKFVSPSQKLWYHRTFAAPDLAGGKRLILHFGAIDFASTVMVNGKTVGTHKGGSEPLEYDVTDALGGTGEQTVVVGVTDPTDQGAQPRGKQVMNPNGIWYTPVTGIWQTAWMEAVPAAHVASMKMVPDVDAGALTVIVNATGDSAGDVTLTATDGGTQIATATGVAGQPISLKVPNAKLWSPDSPHLYDLQVKMGADTVKSYFGMRKIAVKKDSRGVDRLTLNGEAVFMYGPLDQGWWPAGLLTPPSDEAIKFDISMMRKMGFNMARKHIKVEPARWYYWCDRMGLMVWQDMPSGMAEGRSQGVGNGGPDATSFTDAERGQFKAELKQMIDTLDDHPSIVAWVPFNEGWGQHDTNEILKWTMKYDPSRVVDGPSGWTDRGVGDMHDMHNYPGPGMFDPTPGRASVLGEFGGLGLPVQDHLWQTDRNWGYQSFEDKAGLENKYDQLVARLRPLIDRGLSAAVYTQITDVEGEVNGLMTYDRKVIKIDPAHLAKIHARLYRPAGSVDTAIVLPTAQQQPQTWSYTFAKPADDWYKIDYNDNSWKTGPAGFGTDVTVKSHVRTQWATADLWARRTFTLKDADLAEPSLRIYYDEDSEVYLNGQKVMDLQGFSGDYVDLPLSEAAIKALKKGKNVLAVHTHQTIGGQYMDAGIVDMKPKK